MREHVVPFLNTMGAHANDAYICMKNSEKSLIDRVANLLPGALLEARIGV